MAQPFYISDIGRIKARLKDADGEEITDLSVFDDIELWVQAKNSNDVLAEWSVGEGTAELVDTNSRIQFTINDLSGAKVGDLLLFTRYTLTDAEAEGGVVKRTVAYNLFDLLKHAKSFS